MTFRTCGVHTDETAARSARSIGALSETVGTDITFESGRSRRNTTSGPKLLAHHLTQVAQQSDASQNETLAVAPADAAAEREAAAVSNEVAADGPLADPHPNDQPWVITTFPKWPRPSKCR